MISFVLHIIRLVKQVYVASLIVSSKHEKNEFSVVILYHVLQKVCFVSESVRSLYYGFCANS